MNRLLLALACALGLAALRATPADVVVVSVTPEPASILSARTVASACEPSCTNATGQTVVAGIRVPPQR